MKIELETKEAEERVKKLGRYLAPHLLALEGARALNRAALAGATEMNREIRKTLNVRAGDVRDRIEVTRAHRGKLSATIVVDRKPLPLAAFRPRETSKGLRVRILKGSPLQTIPRAFLVGRWGDKPMQRAGAERGPIRTLLGPSVGSQSAEAWASARERADAVFEQRFVRGVNRQIERANR